MKLLLKVKNGTPPMRKQALRQITDKARELGAGPLFNQILPLLMSPTLEDQERPAPCDVYTHTHIYNAPPEAPANALLHARCHGPAYDSPRRTMPTHRAEGRNPGHLPRSLRHRGGESGVKYFPPPADSTVPEGPTH